MKLWKSKVTYLKVKYNMKQTITEIFFEKEAALKEYNKIADPALKEYRKNIEVEN